jgi:hypothetical protein
MVASATPECSGMEKINRGAFAEFNFVTSLTTKSSAGFRIYQVWTSMTQQPPAIRRDR